MQVLIRALNGLFCQKYSVWCVRPEDKLVVASFAIACTNENDTWIIIIVSFIFYNDIIDIGNGMVEE